MSGQERVRAAIIDDHEAIRVGMGAALGECDGLDVELVASAATVPEFLDEAP